jgi:hypothetical protein
MNHKFKKAPTRSRKVLKVNSSVMSSENNFTYTRHQIDFWSEMVVVRKIFDSSCHMDEVIVIEDSQGFIYQFYPSGTMILLHRTFPGIIQIFFQSTHEDLEDMITKNWSIHWQKANPMRCPICFEYYDQKLYIPICFPCGHTFCASHIQKLKSCPICRQTLPRRQNFPVNISIRDASMNLFENYDGSSVTSNNPESFDEKKNLEKYVDELEKKLNETKTALDACKQRKESFQKDLPLKRKQNIVIVKEKKNPQNKILKYDYCTDQISVIAPNKK